MENKKAITTFGLIIIIFFTLFLLIILALFSFGLGLVDSSLSKIDFIIGDNQSFNVTYQELMHPGMVNLSVTSPKMISMATLIGMVLMLLFVGMKSDKKSNLWILLDIAIIIVAEIVGVAIKEFFEESILNLSPELFLIFTTTLAEGSKWILNLPIIIPSIGAILMIGTYVLRKEDKEEEPDGFIQLEQ